ncbi:MAG: hypothetical protein HC895_01035 [Leptolyngbyaceae cyanobacterium SM1_3_5]|nr:hypothetical protein [Leptolyngbyaceae cyanobacterium SM1_3_5]
MNNEDLMQARLKEIMQMGEISAAKLQELLHRQHYDFAHKLIQHLVEKQFSDLIASCINGSIQDWISQIWSKNAGDNSLCYYSLAVQPVCQFVKMSDELGLIYFTMPAPRTTGEALYTAIAFLMDENQPSDWLRRYFTLELGAYSIPSSSPLLDITREDEDPPVGWTFAEWENFSHINRGKFKHEPTLKNFLSAIVTEVKDDWLLL